MAYRSSSANSAESSATALTTTVPAGAATDDIAIVCASYDDPSVTFTWDAGFTELYDQTMTADGHRFGCAWKRLTGADSGNYTATINSAPGARGWVVQAALFSGRHTTNPPVGSTIAVNNSGNSSPISVAANGVTAVAGDDLCWIGGLDVTSAGVGNGCAAPTSFTERQDTEGGGGALWSNMSIATWDNVSAGATGTITGTYSLSSGTAGWVAVLIRIPAAGGAAATSIVPLRRPTRFFPRRY